MTITSDPVASLDTIEMNARCLQDQVYTHPVSARQLLAQQAALLEKHDADLPQLEGQTGRDYQLEYQLQLANLESQEYRHDAARAPFATALAIAEARGDIADRLEVYLAYTGHLSNLGETDAASAYLDRVYRLLESYPDDRLRAQAACRHGYLYLHYFSYPKATTKFLEAETLLQGGTFELTVKDHYVYSITQSGIGSLYQNSGENQLAIEAFTLAISRCEEIGLRARLPWHCLNLGKELINTGAVAAAVPYFQSIIDGAANGSEDALAAAYANLGDCFFQLGQPGPAEAHLNRAEALYRSATKPDTLEIANIGYIRATWLMGIDDWLTAIAQLHAILPIVNVDDETSDPQRLNLVAGTYLFLSICYSKTGDYRAAYEYHCTYDEYNLRYHNQIDLIRQQQFADQFRAEKRERENRELKLRASQLKLRALRAQMNPHFLYNALNSIQSFISSNDAATASKYLAKFAMLMRQSLEYANREYISLEEERQFLTDYLEINRHLRFEGNLTYELVLHPSLEEDVMAVPTMILQPYVENAIEHGLRGLAEGHISVRFEPTDNDQQLRATVTDNGIGRVRVAEIQARDVSRAGHQSRGTEITESRLELLSERGKNLVTIDDLYDGAGAATGTRVTVLIPVSDLPPPYRRE